MSMKQKFCLVVFTASTREYADAILNLIDPYDEYFTYRLYRQNCINHNGYFLKNLQVTLKDVARDKSFLMLGDRQLT